MIWINLCFLALSVYLYCLLGGADFGAGVHEIFIRKKHKPKHEELVKEALGPVWEANHMWLLIAIVILFTGFPHIYTQISIYLHIPVTLMLFGIILRGCAFTFRHYDAVQDHSRYLYSLTFSFSSVLTPIALGVIIGSLMSGYIPKEPTGYYASFIAPWLHTFSFSMGLFVLSIFTFIASIFMLGEKNIGEFHHDYVKRAKLFHMIMILTGALVFLTSEMHHMNLISRFIDSPVALSAFVLAALSHYFLWQALSKFHIWKLRFIAASQLFLVLCGWIQVTFPNVVYYNDNTCLSFFSATFSPQTHFWLAITLITGSFLFLPLLVYLFYIFKLEK